MTQHTDMERRQFLGAAGLAASGLLLPSLDAFSAPAAAGFQLKVLATGWGFTGSSQALCEKAKQEGYDGIEASWPAEAADREALFSALRSTGLAVGFLVGAGTPVFADHLKEFSALADAAARNAIPRPLYVNCHSGRDWFSFEQNARLIAHTAQLARETGIRILHETHRSRMLYSAPVARHFIETQPALRITLDISHWCNVHESFLEDQGDTIDLVLPRVDHIHARIGHPEGPQVNDPRAPEWTQALHAHFAWWDRIVAAKRAAGDTLTILTEFGPPNYMPTLPYTGEPVADQWAINAYMLNALRQRYQSHA